MKGVRCSMNEEFFDAKVGRSVVFDVSKNQRCIEIIYVVQPNGWLHQIINPDVTKQRQQLEALTRSEWSKFSIVFFDDLSQSNKTYYTNEIRKDVRFKKACAGDLCKYADIDVTILSIDCNDVSAIDNESGEIHHYSHFWLSFIKAYSNLEVFLCT